MNLAVDSDTQLLLYTQKIFRQVLDSMARPGKVNLIEPFPIDISSCGKSDLPYLVGLGFTLLDVEVGFHVLNAQPQQESLTAELEFHTTAKSTSLAEADFIFMNAETDPEELTHVKCGTLEYPDTGATVIIAIDYLSEELPYASGDGLELILTGPGILNQKVLYISGLTERHIQTLREINVEYPLGLDLILVCGNQITAVPRSVTINIRGN